MIHNIFLISEKTLKQRSLITDPTLSYVIKPAIECAQKIGLREIIGECLIEKLQLLVSTKTEDQTHLLINMPEYVHYKELLNNYITDYVVYNDLYRLTHLLEKSHLISNGSGEYGRTRPGHGQVVHIKPVSDWANAEIVRRIEEDLSK